jgi:beta-phosphoglucomutase-like phosphatase (HAD superfamily)
VASEPHWIEYEIEQVFPAIEDSTNGILATSRIDITVVAYGDPTEKGVSIADEVAKSSVVLLTTLV